VFAPVVVVFKRGLEPDALGFPPGDFLSPTLLAGTIRAIHDLFLWPQRKVPQLRNAGGMWRQKGIYLHYGETLDEGAYTELFLRFLAGGFLLPPDQQDPLILPGYMSPGEAANLAAACRGA
jgi:hypothetical protein